MLFSNMGHPDCSEALLKYLVGIQSHELEGDRDQRELENATKAETLVPNSML